MRSEISQRVASNRINLPYIEYTSQLAGRLLNTAKIKEVMDTAPFPLLFHIRENMYLIGKGFLARAMLTGDNSLHIKLLAVACYDATKQHVPSLEDVSYYISRAYTADHLKPIHPVVKDIIATFPGTIILCNTIEDMICDTLYMPPGGTLRDQAVYKEGVIKKCVELFVNSSNGQQSTPDRVEGAIAATVELLRGRTDEIPF